MKPSLILLDINMEQMDGFETLSRIRQSHELSSVPVIFLTGDEGRDAEIRCLRAGASDDC
jgi:CheY-like chemotaxis protein